MLTSTKFQALFRSASRDVSSCQTSYDALENEEMTANSSCPVPGSPSLRLSSPQGVCTSISFVRVLHSLFCLTQYFCVSICRLFVWYIWKSKRCAREQRRAGPGADSRPLRSPWLHLHMVSDFHCWRRDSDGHDRLYRPNHYRTFCRRPGRWCIVGCVTLLASPSEAPAKEMMRSSYCSAVQW